MKTIVFTGMMGSGKTTIGKLLSQELQAEFADCDSIIETQENITISEIFNKYGEDYFRKLESRMIKEIFKPHNQVLSLGGGAFENPQTRSFLLEKAFVIYLQTSPQTIFERLKSDTTRPLLKNNITIENISEIISKREQNYKSAHLTILTDDKDSKQIIKEITGAIKC